jgi:hypothetical protein
VQLNVECVKLLQPRKITENELEIRDLEVEEALKTTGIRK